MPRGDCTFRKRDVAAANSAVWNGPYGKWLTLA
jgi:hypothetical protein